MPDTYTTPNMTLVLPSVLVRSGPLYASDLNTAMEGVDAHTHEPGKGVRVPSAGLNINADLPFGGFNATSLRTARFNDQASLPANANDLACTFSYGGNLYWRNAAGDYVQITSGALLNSSALLNSVYTVRRISSNHVIAAADTYTLYLVDTSSGAVAITLPESISVPDGRFIEIKDINGTAGANAISLGTVGADSIDGQSGETLKVPWGQWRLYSNTGSRRWHLFRSAQEVNGGQITRLPAGVTAGNVLKVTGGTNLLGYAAINLAGGAGHVTGVLPAANLPSATTGATGILQLATDLAGTATAPTVVGLSGDGGGVVAMRCNELRWVDSVTAPLVGQTDRTAAGAGALFEVFAQGGHTNNNGGALRLSSGTKAGTGLAGTLEGRINGRSGSLMFEAKEVRAGQRVLALASITSVTTTELPFGPASLGDGVVYLRNAATPPVQGNTVVGGGIMYSSSGRFGWLAPGNEGWEMDGSVTTTATAGTSGATPAQVDFYLSVWIGGTRYKIPCYH